LDKGKQYYEANQKETQRVVDAHRQVSISINDKAKAEGNYYVEAEPKLALVVRIKGLVIWNLMSIVSISWTPNAKRSCNS